MQIQVSIWLHDTYITLTFYRHCSNVILFLTNLNFFWRNINWCEIIKTMPVFKGDITFQYAQRTKCTQLVQYIGYWLKISVMQRPVEKYWTNARFVYSVYREFIIHRRIRLLNYTSQVNPLELNAIRLTQ